MSYLLTPLLAWLVAGTLKFLINSLKARRLAFDLIGNGGLPSNHSAIVGSMVSLIAFDEGIDHPAFGVAIALALVVILDAGGLRRHVGRHADAINRLQRRQPGGDAQLLRVRIGHSRLEIAAGLAVGVAVAAAVWMVVPV